MREDQSFELFHYYLAEHINCFKRIAGLTTFTNSQGSKGASGGILRAIFVIFYNKLLDISQMCKGALVAMIVLFFPFDS